MSKTAESKPAPRASAKASARSPAQGNGGRDISARLFALETEMKHVATASDLAELRVQLAGMKGEITRLEDRITGLRSEMEAGFAGLRGEAAATRRTVGIATTFIALLIALMELLPRFYM